MATAMIPLNIDDAVASDRICTIACNLDTWFMFLGFAVMFSALFTKIRRVHEIMNAAQNQAQQRMIIDWKESILPLGVIVGGNFLVLCIMTFTFPSTWEIVPLQKDQHDRWIETYGHCTHEEQIVYYAIMGGLNFGALIYSMHLSYQTRKVSTEFAESRYIMYAIIAILVTLFQAVPVLFMVRDDRDTQDFLKCSFIFVTVCSVLLFIFYPKIKALDKIRKVVQNDGGYENTHSSQTTSSGGSNGMQINFKSTTALAHENTKLKKMLDAAHFVANKQAISGVLKNKENSVNAVHFERVSSHADKIDNMDNSFKTCDERREYDFEKGYIDPDD